jgi:hypothetical protein
MTTTTPPTIAITMGRSGWDWSRDHRLIRCSDDTEIVRLEDFVDLLLLHREVASRAFGSNQGCARLRLTSEVPRVAAIVPQFAHSELRPRPGRERDSTGGATRKIRGDAGAITTASETTAQFLVIRLWTSVHVVVNKANRMANSLLDFESQRA